MKDIHYRSEAKFGQVEERLTCRCDEADLVRYAVEHSYPLATNSFVMLDYHIPEAGSLQHVEEQMSKDAETQQRLVFGERPLPERFISLTQSHAFDGGACGGEWRVILVLDRDTGEMSGSRYRYAASRHSTTLHMSIEVFGDATASHKSAEGRYNHCKIASPDYG